VESDDNKAKRLGTRGPVAHETAGFDEKAVRIDCRESSARRQGNDMVPIGIERGLVGRHESAIFCAAKLLKAASISSGVVVLKVTRRTPS
jgi:hypothetical protein